MEDKFILVKFSANYADEFDIEGLQVFKKSEWEERVESLKEAQDELEDGIFLSFGTNEEVEFKDLEEFLEAYSVVEITKEQFDFMKQNVCGKDGFGHWLFDQALNLL